MPIYTDRLRLEPEEAGVDRYHASLGETLGAAAGEAFADSPLQQLVGISQLEIAKGNDYAQISAGEEYQPAPAPTMLAIDAARARVKEAGLDKDLKLPDRDIAEPALSIMIDRARVRREREATMQRGPQGIMTDALSVGTSFLVGAVDPINIASAFIPVMGEARYAKLLANAGESLLARSTVRAGVGAAQGALGQAALEPLDWWAHTQDGRDFGMADVLHNVLFGAALGGALHSGGGAIADTWRKRQGTPVYPFGPGEPLENVHGTHVPGALMGDEGVTRDTLDQHLPEPPRPSPALMTIDDLPMRAKEDVARAGIASLIDGEPLKVGELLEAAAKTDPRIAESFEAWHGSPHDVERFSTAQIGTGEGAQTYGHGLYFAENEKVARQYQRSTTGQDFIRKVQELYDQGDSPNDAHAAVAESTHITPGQKRLLAALEKDDWLGFDYPHQAVSAALSDPHGKRWEMSPETLDAIKHAGNLYQVRISASHEHFLDWDKPLNEQTDHVRKAIDAVMAPHAGTDSYTAHPDLGGRSPMVLLSDLSHPKYAGSNEAASRALHDAGIPGVKYLDLGSRGAGDGTRNFVVFDDKHIEITHKNGEPVASANPKIVLGEDLPADVTTKDVTKPKPRGRAATAPETWSLNEHLASKGGLAPDPELKAIYGTDRGPFLPGFGPLIRKSGMSLDDALSSAKEHGYMLDPSDMDAAENGTLGSSGRTGLGLTPNDLLDRLDAENRGQKQHKIGYRPKTKYDPEQEKHVILGHLENEIEASGGSVKDIDPALLNRTVEIVHREGESDVLAAFERAIMEDAERYEGLANARRDTADLADIPGWDHPDAGAAPRDGGAGAGAGRAAGLPDSGAGGADGAQPRNDGRGDRGAGADGLDRDAAWRALSQPRPEFDHPDIVAASQAASQAPQPPTKLEERVSAAEKAEAFARQMYDMFADRLSEQDRQRLDDLIKAIDDHHEARETAIVRGGGCLFGVV